MVSFPYFSTGRVSMERMRRPETWEQWGYVGHYNGRLYSVSFGPNGLGIDDQGRVVWCAQGDRAIGRLEKDGNTRTILADKYQGKRLNRPNDLVIKSDGWV